MGLPAMSSQLVAIVAGNNFTNGAVTTATAPPHSVLRKFRRFMCFLSDPLQQARVSFFHEFNNAWVSERIRRLSAPRLEVFYLVDAFAVFVDYKQIYVVSRIRPNKKSVDVWVDVHQLLATPSTSATAPLCSMFKVFPVSVVTATVISSTSAPAQFGHTGLSAASENVVA